MSAAAPDAGLCARCAHGHVQTSAQGGRFWRCLAAAHDARLRRYPPLPVRACPAFAPGRPEAPESTGGATRRDGPPRDG